MKLAIVMASTSFLPHQKISIRTTVIDDKKFGEYLKSDVKLNGNLYRLRLSNKIINFMKEHNMNFVGK